MSKLRLPQNFSARSRNLRNAHPLARQKKARTAGSSVEKLPHDFSRRGDDRSSAAKSSNLHVQPHPH
ncbi:MAG: hypothetical protein DME26_05115 [Verrucomicrobia bacterium]|nr:MAG: hypothetical protein DME26_05115 [Verrucomicrobiota bacterium]